MRALALPQGGVDLVCLCGVRMLGGALRDGLCEGSRLLRAHGRVVRVQRARVRAHGRVVRVQRAAVRAHDRSLRVQDEYDLSIKKQPACKDVR